MCLANLYADHCLGLAWDHSHVQSLHHPETPRNAHCHHPMKFCNTHLHCPVTFCKAPHPVMLSASAPWCLMQLASRHSLPLATCCPLPLNSSQYHSATNLLFAEVSCLPCWDQSLQGKGCRDQEVVNPPHGDWSSGCSSHYAYGSGLLLYRIKS